MLDVFKTVENLGLRKGEYVVVGSGILGALGLREVNDVDIVVSPEVLRKFQDKSGWESQERWGKTFVRKGDVELFSQLSWSDYDTTREEAIRSARYINDVAFLNTQETIEFKRAIGREKDMHDIELLKKHAGKGS